MFINWLEINFNIVLFGYIYLMILSSKTNIQKCFPVSFYLSVIIWICPIIKLNAYTSNDLVYEDKIYNPSIKTVNLYINNGSINAVIEPATIDLVKPDQLILEFDELYADARYLQAKILHCNWDWTPSQLRSIEYLDDYNEFDINDYEYSVNTLIDYTHYTFLVPRVKIPGNYLLVVYDRNNPDELLLSHRFIVYDHLVHIAPRITLSSGIQERRSMQQVEFDINYEGLTVLNPSTDFKVVVRKNHSWLTAKYNLKPTFVRELQKTMEYRHFNLENDFFGGNEYRFFDLKSVKAPGRNIDHVNLGNDRIDAFLFKDRDRSREFYSQWQDYDGGFIIANIDGSDPKTEADYVNVHFFLESDHKLASDIYIYGELSQYNLLDDYQLSYEADLGGYLVDLLLKQGWYDYIYYTPDASSPYSLEGNHYETENDYEILVYFRPPGKISEYLVGYVQLNSRP